MSTSDRGASVSDEGLRIAWQYRKYFGDERTSGAKHRDSKQEFSNDFDLRKRLEWHLLNAQHIQCLSTQVVDTLSDLQNRCSTFLYKHPRWWNSECWMNCYIFSVCTTVWIFCKGLGHGLVYRSLKATMRASNIVAVMTFPYTVSNSFCKRWQHLADTLLSEKQFQMRTRT